jgi:hypothetical protein
MIPRCLIETARIRSRSLIATAGSDPVVLRHHWIRFPSLIETVEPFTKMSKSDPAVSLTPQDLIPTPRNTNFDEKNWGSKISWHCPFKKTTDMCSRQLLSILWFMDWFATLGTAMAPSHRANMTKCFSCIQRRHVSCFPNKRYCNTAVTILTNKVRTLRLLYFLYKKGKCSLQVKEQFLIFNIRNVFSQNQKWGHFLRESAVCFFCLKIKKVHTVYVFYIG